MKPVEVLAVDFLTTLRILRSVAAAKEISQSTKYGWRTTDLIGSANMWGEVGMWEQEVPNGPQLRAAIQVATRERAMIMLDMARHGPVPLVRWLMAQVKIRDEYLNNYFTQVSAFGEINQSTLNALDASVKLAKSGRFVASVGLITGSVALAVYGMGITISGGVVAGFGQLGTTIGLGTAIGVPVVGLGKSVAFAVIKNWDNAPSAQALSIVLEVGKTATNESLGASGRHATTKGGIVAATAVSVDGDLIIMREARSKAAALAERNVMDAEARFKQMLHMRIGGQSAKGVRQWAGRIAEQRGVVAAEKKAFQHASQDLATASEKIAAQQLEREALQVARAQALRRLGKVLMGGATAAFAIWDLYDTVGELGE